ncbi:hypothetical protein OG21DRAFT_1491404 [Imleria badia]|nr:hypothetical protein OG21DRAFT_1491404 [Imleria badia]
MSHSDTKVFQPIPTYPTPVRRQSLMKIEPTPPSSPSLTYLSTPSPSSSTGRNFSQGTDELEPISMTTDKLNLMHSPLCWDEFLGRIVHFQNTVIAPHRWLQQRRQSTPYRNIPSLLIDKKVPLAGDTLPCQMLEISSRLAHFIRIENVYQGPDVLIEDWNLPMDTYYSGHHTTIQGLSYWDEPLALVYGGTGLAFLVASYHETPQIPTHFQGFEIIHHTIHPLTKLFVDTWNTLPPNDVIDPAVIDIYLIWPGSLKESEGDVVRKPEGEYAYLHHCHQRLAPYGGRNQHAVSDIILRRVWNEIMDARWRCVWKRKHPWFDAWRSAESQVITLRLNYEPGFYIGEDRPLIERHPSLGPGDQEVEEPDNVRVPHIHHHQSPLANRENIPATHWVRRSYVSHNKRSIGFHKADGRYASIPNPHFFEETKFQQFEELEPDYFKYLRSLETSDKDDSDRDESKVQQLLGEDMTSETTGDDTDDYEEAADNDEDDDTPLTSVPMPFSVTKANKNFFQTFVANIFIF